MPRRTLAGFARLDPEGFEASGARIAEFRRAFEGRAIWHVSRSSGDSVAEMLRSIVGYTRDGGVDAHWLVASADHGFHTLTRRLYHRLYGSPGDGGPLGEDEAALLERVGAEQARELTARIRPEDIVFLHDTPGLVRPVKETGARAVWRCHLGMEDPNREARSAWGFLWPFVSEADAFVFSRRVYRWDQVPEERFHVLRPGIDPFSPKNELLDDDLVAAVFDQIGLGASGTATAPTFRRSDGTPQRLSGVAVTDQEAPVPADAPVVAQISGWERTKGQLDVLEAFAGHCREGGPHLLLVGPAVADRPSGSEEAEVLAELRSRRAELDPGVAARIHLVQLPLSDLEENAVMVNAIQRRADVVVHAALQEGFGFSVTEAMLKRAAVVATRTGGLAVQLVDGESGLHVEPGDRESIGGAVARLLADQQLRERLGEAARERVVERYLVFSHLSAYVELIENLAAPASGGSRLPPRRSPGTAG